MSDPSQPGHPIGPEVDDSGNPTTASPADTTDTAGTDWTEPAADAGHASSRTQENVRDMLAQLQAMIDNVAEQAGPVLRDVAAKAAELAAVAGERAGPMAYRAAEKTQVVGQRVAQRSKELAADLRRPQHAPAGDTAAEANDVTAQAADMVAEGAPASGTTNTGDAWGEAGASGAETGGQEDR